MNQNKSLKDLGNEKLNDRNFSRFTNLSTRLTPKSKPVKQPATLNKKTSSLMMSGYTSGGGNYSEIGESSMITNIKSNKKIANEPSKPNKPLTQSKLKYYNPMDKSSKTTGTFKNSKTTSHVDIDTSQILRNKPNEYKRRTIMRLDTDKKNEGKLGRTFSVLGYKGRDNINAYDDYINNGNKAKGRGFGNVNVLTKIDRGKQTRERGDDITSTELSGYKFHSTFRNFHDPSHVVMDIPRGGLSTRRKGRYILKNNKFHK